jgi:membrane protein DedA with SNARE-associated domain
VAFVGSTLGDQLYFLLSRRFGQRFIENRPRVQARVDKALRLLERWDSWFILSFRFMYGLRAVSSIAIGLTRVPIPRFALLNMIGAALWAVGLGGAGYLLGEALEVFFKRLSEWDLPVFLAIAAIALVLWLIRRSRTPRVSNPAQPPASNSGGPG